MCGLLAALSKRQAKFILDSQHKRSLEDDVSRLKGLLPWIGSVSLDRLHMGTLQPWIEPLSQAMSAGIVQPVVHAAVPFANAGEAHRILAARENVGKVVLVP